MAGIGNIMNPLLTINMGCRVGDVWLAVEVGKSRFFCKDVTFVH